MHLTNRSSRTGKSAASLCFCLPLNAVVKGTAMAETLSRIEQFNLLCGVIFEHLYDHFPVAVYLDFTEAVQDLQAIDSVDVTEVAELDEVFAQTMEWLEE